MLQVSSFELTYGKRFLGSDLLIDEEVFQLLPYTINLGQAQKALQEYGNKILPGLNKDYQHKQVKLGDMVYLKCGGTIVPNSNYNTDVRAYLMTR